MALKPVTKERFYKAVEESADSFVVNNRDHLKWFYNESPDKCFICSCCGGPGNANYLESDELTIILERNYCFNCAFWELRAEQQHRFIIVGGVSYSPGDENAKGMRGHGGRRFVIELEDGTEIVSTNLWCQSDVPANFIDRFERKGKFK